MFIRIVFFLPPDAAPQPQVISMPEAQQPVIVTDDGALVAATSNGQYAPSAFSEEYSHQPDGSQAQQVAQPQEVMYEAQGNPQGGDPMANPATYQSAPAQHQFEHPAVNNASPFIAIDETQPPPPPVPFAPVGTES